MRNSRIYLYTTIGFVLVYIVTISFVVIPLTLKSKSTVILQNDIDLVAQEIQQMSVISGDMLSQKIDKKSILNSIQKATSGSDNENVYLTVFDWSGKIVSHPDKTKIGGKNQQKSNTISNMKSVVTGDELYQLVKDNVNNTEETSEIIDMRPIPDSDLIIAGHLNIKNIQTQINAFKEQLVTVFFILGLILLVLILSITRVLSLYYERIIDRKAAKFEDGVLNLSKLNTSLENYQKSMASLQEKSVEKVAEEIIEEDTKEVPKQRLLTYIRNELMPIAVEDIAYIYVENSISYVVRKDGKRFTANDSLDQIYATLDSKLFFRANRQTIVAIYAIDKIIKYGNSALKIEMQPISEIDIVIGKNKVSVFKKWLDM
ncbi:LytR/AlgR family response regulator transcription factor [Kordia jejudonensis]|uniref:LytR/AlgR family response regulator transcription factor n=1 Tax=Kordia jejudonensis TaxID=1348245 RepID=UPI00062969AA|nr:LytTR family DNA-binding domain-containing protein [Kordia jejudonensis]